MKAFDRLDLLRASSREPAARRTSVRIAAGRAAGHSISSFCPNTLAIEVASSAKPSTSLPRVANAPQRDKRRTA